MDSVRQQNDWLNKELQEKMHELMTSRKEKVSLAPSQTIGGVMVRTLDLCD